MARRGRRAIGERDMRQRCGRVRDAKGKGITQNKFEGVIAVSSETQDRRAGDKSREGAERSTEEEECL